MEVCREGAAAVDYSGTELEDGSDLLFTPN